MDTCLLKSLNKMTLGFDNYCADFQTLDQEGSTAETVLFFFFSTVHFNPLTEL
jgi:hypothetical protein